jgi:hypothetical protein
MKDRLCVFGVVAFIYYTGGIFFIVLMVLLILYNEVQPTMMGQHVKW